MNYNDYFTFDLECTTQEPTETWLACVCNFNAKSIDEVQIKYNIKDLIHLIFSKRNKSVFYAHNLKYDMSFILSYLFKYHKDEFLITRKLVLQQTKAIISISINFMNKTMTFRDSLVLFSTSLDNVLRAYTNLEKGITPIYKTMHEVEYSDYNINYCKIDTYGLALALKERLKYGDNALTTASGAFKEFRNIFNTVRGNFSNYFPLLDYDLQKAIRKAYRGGFTYLNECYAGKYLNHVDIIDVNSMYPAQMFNKLLPYGTPKVIEWGEIKTDDIYKLGIQKFTISSCILKEGFIPFLSNKNTIYGTNSYETMLTEADDIEDRTFLMTLQEFELFKKSYDYEGLSLEGGYLFKARKDMFKEYINKFWEMKSSKDPIISANGKLFLNSLYGKFAENPDKIELEIFYDENKRRLNFRVENENTVECGYLPIGVFITSYARCFLVESILKIGVENFVYCDTDSIHYINNADISDLEMDKKELGKWSVDGHYNRAFYIRAKRYIGELDGGKLKIACAGIKKQSLQKQIRKIEDFKEGVEIHTFKFGYGENGQYVYPTIVTI